MLFNSPVFLLFFLPIVLAGFFVFAGTKRHRLAGVWLVGASLFFYGWWNAHYLLLLIASILFNYLLGGWLMRHPSKWLLAFGVAANVLLLGYYKYTGFLIETVDRLSGLDWAIPSIALPLAISFFTFQQIAFLLDAHDGAVNDHDFINYCLFITFFPHLIAGPITHHREMFPQFNDPDVFRPRLQNLAVGSTLFLIGLFKKVVIADSMGEFARPVFAAAAMGAPPSFLEAWCGALSYAFQIYFDFSGYTDMAIGLGVMFGISLPPNFDSPFKARNIIEFWSRWHMTLTRFVTAYIYNPIVLRLTRWRARKGLALPKRGRATPGAFVTLIAFPTILSMLIIGMWHGAGWQFGVFGLLHGIFLTINHGWRQVKVRLGLPIDSDHPLALMPSVLVTFLCVLIALIFFRAENVAAGVTLLASMAGEHGVVMPERLLALPGVSALRDAFDLPVANLEYFGLTQVLWITGLFVVVWGLPNAQQWLRHDRTALVTQTRASWLQTVFPILVWRPASLIGLAVGWLGFFLIIRAFSAAPTEFLYFQF